MQLVQYVVDAFECGPFTGNPAAVVPLDAWIPQPTMQSIAMQNNLSETAFFVWGGSDYELRWFTPTVEVDLCGHATLASAHVLFDELDAGGIGRLAFSTRSGELIVRRGGAGYEMRLPVATPRPSDAPSGLLAALNGGAAEVLVVGSRYLVVYDGESVVNELEPDISALAEVEMEMVVVTAPSSEFDYVERVFAPRVGISEDPATGSAQCLLAPYWTERLGKSEVDSFQASARGAEVGASLPKGHKYVDVRGRCRTFSRGEISIDA